jgi:hypothetical protein
MDKFALSLEDAMQEDHESPFLCKYKMNLLPKVARNDMQGHDIRADKDKRLKFMREDPLS